MFVADPLDGPDGTHSRVVHKTPNHLWKTGWNNHAGDSIGNNIANGNRKSNSVGNGENDSTMMMVTMVIVIMMVMTVAKSITLVTVRKK